MTNKKITSLVMAFMLCSSTMFASSPVSASPAMNLKRHTSIGQTSFDKNVSANISLTGDKQDTTAVKENASKVDEKASIEVNNMIEALPSEDNITFDDETAINNANLQFNKLNPAQKQLVTAVNKAKLNTVTAKLSKLKDWTLMWSDEFDGNNGSAPNPAKWVYDIGKGANGDGWGNNEKEIYTNSTDNVYIQGGKLVIAAKKDSSGNITSGRIKTMGKLDMKYGRVDVRAKLPVGAGYWPAIWMLPTDYVYGTWAASGEIDIMENKGRLPGEVYGTLHYGGAWPLNKYTGATYKFKDDKDVTSFHTYSLEWEPGEIRWLVDGRLYQTQTNWNSKDSNGEKYAFAAPFDQKFHLLLNLAYGGNFDNGIGDGTNIPGQMVVDYVRAYNLTGRPYKTPVEPSVSVDQLPAGAKQPDSTGNLLSNGDFTNPIKDNPTGTAPFGYDWNFVHSTDTGNGNATVETIGGKNYAKIDVTNAGQNNYSVQLIQETTLGKGRWYKLSFDAKTNSTRNLGVKIGGGPNRGYTAYADSLNCNLTDTFQTFTTNFQMNTETDLIARVEFELGLNTNPVWIGNVKLEEIPAPVIDYNASKKPLADGNLVYNGKFDKVNMDRMTYWNFNTANSASATAAVSETTRELAVNIANGGSEPGAVVVSQSGTQLEKDATYTLTFKARSSSDATISAGICSKDGNQVYAPYNSFQLAKEMTEYTYRFAMDNTTDLESRLEFRLGGNTGNIFLDDVSLKKSIDYSKIDVYPLKNGDFSLGTDGLAYWTCLPSTIGDATSTITAANNEAKISISNPGATAYSIMLIQGGMKLAANVEYKVAFDARSTVGRSILVTAENATYHAYFSKIMALNGTNTHYEYTFVMPVDEALDLKFQLGNVEAAPAVQHDIYISNVKFEVNNAPVKRAPLLTSSVTNNRIGQPVNITFADDAAWRNAIAAVKLNGVKIDAAGYSVSEGKLTLNADNFTSAGEYNIQVLATGYASTSCVQIMKSADNLLVTNGTFDTSVAGWKTYTGDGSSAVATAENGEMKVTFSNYPGWNKWSTQVYQDTIALEAGKTYLLKFDARATAARNAWIEMTGMDPKTISLTDTNQTFSFEFTPTAASSAGKLNFLLGTENVDGSLFGSPQSVFIDNVSIVEKAPVNNVLITNGTFDTNVDGWKTYAADGSSAVTTAENGEMKVTFTNYPGWFKWSTQVYQDTITLEAGKTYVVKFDARASAARNAWIEMTGMDPKTISLTDANQTFSFEFTPTTATSAGKLNFLLGTENVDGTLFGSPQSVFIDNVSIVEKVPVSSPFITNGTFDANVDGWKTYAADGSSAVTTAENGEMRVTFTNYPGWFTWSTQVYQDTIVLEAGKTYVVKFDARATAARNAWIEMTGMDSKTISLTDTNQTFTFEFTPTTATTAGKLNFLLGTENVAGTLFGSPQSVFIDNVSIVEKASGNN